MQVALAEHPEWEGDWEMPSGLTQVEINPKTGEPSAPGDTEKRTELFINGTGPNHIEDLATEEATPEPEASPQIEEPPVAEPSPVPLPSPKVKPSIYPPEGARLEGTITLDIDPTTGLIAVESCPVVRTTTFVLGTEPRKYCGPQYHKNLTTEPSGSRPGVVVTPPP